jgi:hypothetical protein
MKTTNDGGPAFPTVARDGNWQPHHDGLSLRDYFAGQALAGLCVPGLKDGPITDWKFDEIAPVAWRAADAMLAAREGKQ